MRLSSSITSIGLIPAHAGVILWIMRNFDGLKDKITLMIAGEKVSVNTAKFQNDITSLNSADDVLALLGHLGNLSHHAA